MHLTVAAYAPKMRLLAQSMPASEFSTLCAHQGLSRACPSNTLPAFGAAVALGVHEIEFDLWLSRDGVPVVCHDPTVDRTTNGVGSIDQMTWPEICELDAGIKTGQLWRGVRVPRLEQVVGLFGGRVAFNIHVKHPGPEGELARLVCDTLRRERLVRTCCIAGEVKVLEVVHEYAPEIVSACFEPQSDPKAQADIALRYGCRRIQFGRSVNSEAIQEAHRAGLICNLFWSDDPADAFGYVENGIDVVLTNCANVLIAGGFAPAEH